VEHLRAIDHRRGSIAAGLGTPTAHGERSA